MVLNLNVTMNSFIHGHFESAVLKCDHKLVKFQSLACLPLVGPLLESTGSACSIFRPLEKVQNSETATTNVPTQHKFVPHNSYVLWLLAAYLG